MFRNRSTTHIIHTWQDEVEQSVEAGSSPILELGSNALATDDVVSLAAMQQWDALRTDISTPCLPSGGSGPLWIASMMRPLRSSSRNQASEPVLMYAGVNEAEYLLTVAMLHTAVRPRDSSASVVSAIPTSYFAPQSQPAMSISWDALPFFALDMAPGVPRVETAKLDDGIDEEANDPIEDWLAWAGLLLALFLILLAILL